MPQLKGARFGPYEIDKLLGPRGYQEETQEALEAVGLAPARSGDGRDAQP